MRMASSVAAVLGGVWLLGCGDEDGARDRPAPEVLEFAGGQTSEFGGGSIGSCPEVRSETELDATRPEIARWLALAVGHHEISLRWVANEGAAEARGYQQTSTLSLDVSLVRALDVVYGAGGSTNYELSSCEGLRQRRFEVAIALATSDGALQGTVRQWLEPREDAEQPDRDGLVTAGLVPSNGVYDLAELGGTLELGSEALGAHRIGVGLEFTADRVLGSVALWEPTPGSLPEEQSQWSPLGAKFPDDGCPNGFAVPLDEPHVLFGETPRAVYEAAQARWESAVQPAAWVPLSDAFPRTLTRTEVTLRAGAPTQACEVERSIELYAPLRIESADGRVRYEPTVISSFHPHSYYGGQHVGYAYATSHSSVQWIARDRFAGVTGMNDVDLGTADSGLAQVSLFTTSKRDQVDGSLQVYRRESFVEDEAEHPILHWCSGTDCERYFCLLQQDDAAACPELGPQLPVPPPAP